MSIKIENLDYVYSEGSPFERKALDNINLNIDGGEFIGLIGHTGSGKSTLVQHLNGLLKPHSGRVLIDETETTVKGEELKKLRCKVGLVFQYPEHQLFEETVYKDIAFGPNNLGLSKEETNKRVTQAMNYVGLSQDLLDKSPFDLSGGQKRRVAIAGVLAMEPSVLVLDEPTAGLDPAGREEILTQIKSIYLKSKITVILVSHSMEDVARLVNRLIVMNGGKVAMDGTVSEVFSRGDELRGMGLEVPQIHLLVDELIRRGVPLNKNIYTVEKAKSAITLYINSKKETKDA
ncbi:MAG: energy-coupling factor transporter ATPase [Clostridia bacterium]|nr:energy-coupling factor transporter ATPase [Clostridia bacterium]